MTLRFVFTSTVLVILSMMLIVNLPSHAQLQTGTCEEIFLTAPESTEEVPPNTEIANATESFDEFSEECRIYLQQVDDTQVLIRQIPSFNYNNIDFSGQMLRHADFSTTSAQFANFQQTDLGNADFAGSILTGSNFSEANLAYAYMPLTLLEDANFTDAILASATLSHANLSNATFNNADLWSVTLTDVAARNTQFVGADVSEANLEGGQFINADFEGAILSYSVIYDTDFTWANLTNAVMDLMDMGGTINFTNANLSGTILTNRLTTNSPDMFIFTGADLTDANLTGSDLEGADFTDAIWSNTTCPDGSNSDDHANSCEGHLTS